MFRSMFSYVSYVVEKNASNVNLYNWKLTWELKNVHTRWTGDWLTGQVNISEL